MWQIDEELRLDASAMGRAGDSQRQLADKRADMGKTRSMGICGAGYDWWKMRPGVIELGVPANLSLGRCSGPQFHYQRIVGHSGGRES